MFRFFSYIFVLLGLILAAVGLRSIWTTKQSELQAEREWTHIIDSQPARPILPKVNPGEPFARLSIERLGGEWVVVEGAGTSELRKGPGHLINTALPGSRGNCVIAGHRDTQFRVLRKVEIGEEIGVEIGGRTYRYRVTDTSVVSPNDVRSLQPTPTPILTLVTCYPFYYVGPAPKRFVIRAELVS